MRHLDMPLGDFIRRASTYILGSEEEGVKYQLYEDNEILFCKNNVCVHPLPTFRNETDAFHNPGYLTINTKVFVDQYTETKRPTLFLTWIPNSKFVKSSSTINRNSLLRNDNSQRNSIESLTSTDSNGSSSEVSREFKSTNPFFSPLDKTDSMSESLSSDDGEKQGTVISINVDIANPAIEITTPDSIKDATESFHDIVFSRSESDDKNGMSWCGTNENLTQKPNSTTSTDLSVYSPILTRKTSHTCRRFSVDLSQMRSLRLFFNDDTCTCGQLVVASRESQYKILHFHHGGLDHLAQILHQWHSLLHSIKYAKGCDDNLPYRHFMVCRPEVSDLELHPEEGQVSKLTEEIFHNIFTECGQLEDDLLLRKYVFFAGMDRSLRKQIWPFLLHVYPYQTTYDERNQIMEIRRLEYAEITKRRLELSGSRLKHFKRNVKSIVEKDVVRTDRSNPFFAGDDNPNLEIMKNILLNYSVFNSGLGYTQGMSDLLAPVLCELKDEVLAFWCFVGLMQRAVFVATPTDRDMDISLRYLRNLIRIMVPNFYHHLAKHKDSMELLFCHRWILLCFKREFTEGVALRMWEACWANYLTDYFHLFLCLAIICVYAEDVITQDLKADEMLLYFSSLAMYMDGVLILRKARGLLHQFRQLREIPCSLAGLCSRCGPGIWDSTHSPLIYCSGHEKEASCNICIN
ncbi:hypothetical protein WA026_010702 [Henosepilachna vigintioctopunctata]|uniref:Rab-GAP TBC domain-containing protein n=1 Tax=Henosepilachna vigintioctopunctata TaxID=420089 RepID=A0AAW1UZ97_9CUCU